MVDIIQPSATRAKIKNLENKDDLRRQTNAIRFEDVLDGRALSINDLVFNIDLDISNADIRGSTVTNIYIGKININNFVETLRTQGSIKTKSGRGSLPLVLKIVFVGEEEINNNLRRLIAEIRNIPYIIVENNLIRQAITPGMDIESSDKSMAFTVTSAVLNTVPGLPNTWTLDMNCVWFNYEPYGNKLLFRKKWEAVDKILESDSSLQLGNFGLKPTQPVRFPGLSQPYLDYVDRLVESETRNGGLKNPLQISNRIKFKWREYIYRQPPSRRRAELLGLPRQGALVRPSTADLNILGAVDLRINSKVQEDLEELSGLFKRRFGRALPITSMFRTKAKQKEFSQKDKETANQPGTSTHESGQAIDVLLSDYIDIKRRARNFSISREYGVNLEEWKWLIGKSSNQTSLEKTIVGHWKVSKEEFSADESWHFTHQRSGNQREAYEGIYRTDDEETVAKFAEKGGGDSRDITKTLHGGDILLDAKEKQRNVKNEVTDTEFEKEIAKFIEQHEVNGFKEYTGPSAFKTNDISGVFYKDRELIISGDADEKSQDDLVPIHIVCSFDNRVSSIPLLGHQYATHQFVGSSDVHTTINMASLSESSIGELTNMINTTESNAIKFRRVPLSGVIQIDNDVLKTMGVERVIIDRYDINSTPESPNLRSVLLSLQQYGFTKEELRQDNIKVNGRIQQVAIRILLNLLEEETIDGLIVTSIKSFKVKDEIRNNIGKAFLADRAVQLLRVLQKRQRTMFDGIVQQRQGWLELLGAEEFLVPAISDDPLKTLESAFLSGNAEQDTVFGRTKIKSFIANSFTFIQAGFRQLIFDPFVLLEGKDIDDMPGLFASEVKAIGSGLGSLANNLSRSNQTIDMNILIEAARVANEKFGDEFTQGIIASQDAILERTRDDLLRVVNDLIFEISNTDGIDTEFARQFSELTPLINEILQLDNINSKETYPDLSLPPHPLTGKITDTEPDFYIFNASEEGGLGDITPNIRTVARETLSRSISSFQEITAPGGILETDARYKIQGKGGKTAKYEVGPDSPSISNSINIPAAKAGDSRGVFKFSHDAALKRNRNAYPEGRQIKLGRDLKDKSDPVLNPQNEQHSSDQENLMNIINDFTTQSDDTLTLRRAFPSFKLYFIESDSDTLVKGFDDWYSYNAIKEIQLVKTRKNPVDYLIVDLSNVSGLLDNRVFNDARQSNERDEAQEAGNETIEFFDPEKVNTEQENPFERLILKPGMKVELRLGYSNDPSKMPLEFIGQITEIQPIENGDCIRIMCQSYATELIYKIKGDDPKAEQGWFHSDTGGLLGKMICEPEVTHFGRWKFRDRIFRSNERAATQGRNNIFNRWSFLDQPQDDNIFAPKRESYFQFFPDLFGAGDKPSFILDGILDYNVYQTTIWEVFKEMELRHPGFIASPVPFEGGGNKPNRMTMFFGVPSQRYWARGATRGEQNFRRITNDLEDAASDLRTGNSEPRSLLQNILSPYAFPNDIDAIPRLSFQQLRQLDILKRDQVKLQDKLQRLVNKRHRSFRSYHLFTSDHNIVANNIKASSKGVFNQVIVQYVRDTSHQVGFLVGANTVEKDGTVNYIADDIVKMKADDDIPDNKVIEAKFAYPNCEGPRMAKRYGLGLLLRHLKDVYKGSLIVLGKPGIKPYDICYVYDSYTGMYGPVEVEQVTQIISQDTGWVTEIIPDMCIYGNEFSNWPLLEAGSVVAGHIFNNISLRLPEIPSFEQTVTNPGPRNKAIALGVIGGLALASAPLTTLGGSVLLGFGAVKFIRYTQNRQPLKIWPLMYHKKPYIAGLDGYKTNKVWTSVHGKLSLWWDTTRKNFTEGFNITLSNVDAIFS